MADPTITIIGTGNVAWHLAQAVCKAGFRVKQVYGRDPEKAVELSQLVPGSDPTIEPDFTRHKADIYLIALVDSAVPAFMQQAVFPENSLVAHTSGSLPLEVLQSKTPVKKGVFYPLQTFTKSRPIEFKQVPLLLEAEDRTSLDQLKKLALQLSNQVQEMPFAERKKLHLAAVFACNFTNHLLGISHQLVTQNQLNWELLKPLITETLIKALELPPFSVQTGPAIRHDQVIINEHVQLLASQPAYQHIYQLLTQSIQEHSKKIAFCSRFFISMYWF